MCVHTRIDAGATINVLDNQAGVAVIDIPYLALLPINTFAHMPLHSEQVRQKAVAAPQVHKRLGFCAKLRGSP